jgi:GNAT superfamily N-acetyltransferase
MIKIRSFETQDADSVRSLFSQGLMDFAQGSEREVGGYVQESLSDDLADINASYMDDPANHFWVADEDGVVKGMVGVQWRSDEEAELRRMSVASTARRQGVGLMLLETVEGFCRDRGHRRIILTTVTLLEPAIAMYQRFGFQLTGEESYGRISAQHFAKELTKPD